MVFVSKLSLPGTSTGTLISTVRISTAGPSGTARVSWRAVPSTPRAEEVSATSPGRERGGPMSRCSSQGKNQMGIGEYDHVL